jgi:hypothetical protein
MTATSISTISEGKVDVYITISDFDMELNPANGAGERFFSVRLQNSGSVVAECRLRSSVRDFGSGEVPAIRLGGDGNTVSSAGFPYAFDKSSLAITFGMTIDLDGDTYKYWINTPDDDGSEWAAPFSGIEGPFVNNNIINQLRFVIDHTGGGDTPLPANYFNIDRILILHESSIAPATVALASATEDDAVTISSNTTTTSSARVQSLTIDAGTTLIVDADHELTVIDDLIINGTLLVTSTGSLKTFGGITISGGGSFTKERTTTYGASDGKYSIVGAPISDATTDDLGGITYKYDESIAYGAGNQERFTLINSSESMNPGDGYFSANLGAASFSGTPNSGVVSAGLVYDAGEGSDAGWNCVANPFPAAINLYSFATNNPFTTGSIYLWDDGGSDAGQRDNNDYIVVTASGTATMGSSRAADFDGYIRSEQGFFVQATSAGTLVFNDVMKAGINANSAAGYFRKAEGNSNLLRVFLSNKEVSSNMVLEINPRATAGYDRLFDARRINTGKDVNIYSILGEDELAIQAMNDHGLNEEIWLGMDIAEAGNYSIDFQYGINDLNLYLHDHQTNKIINLSEVSSYTFYSEGLKVGEKRFSLSRVSGVLAFDEELKADVFTAFFHDEVLELRFGGVMEDAAVTVHDIQGRLLINESGINAPTGVWTSKAKFNPGIYIVRLANKNNIQSIKILKSDQ